MDRDVIELVLKEFADEQKSTNQHICELIKTAGELKGKLKDFEKHIIKPQTVSDTKPFLLLLQKGLMDIQTIVENQPKSITKKFQLLLFPEQDAKLFYKIVFGRWFLWLTVILAINNIYKWGVHDSDNQKEIKIEQLENDKIRRSWKYLYKHGKKSIQKDMEKAFEHSTLIQDN
ncbi:hypothetical protein I5M32_07835 [Pedobacter sp. SD-b]|uniref:Uncharacterized protein n=1 Tax=Pedobacter segetis TaxID=2793069 RepID=A0ABS1BJ56_9SPHI|nr:hypothetical protein [Pedobacter segetis]MBK0382868.1 hypothetical protein [Pedobacter segetis]